MKTGASNDLYFSGLYAIFNDYNNFVLRLFRDLLKTDLYFALWSLMTIGLTSGLVGLLQWSGHDLTPFAKEYLFVGGVLLFGIVLASQTAVHVVMFLGGTLIFLLEATKNLVLAIKTKSIYIWHDLRGGGVGMNPKKTTAATACHSFDEKAEVWIFPFTSV